MAAEQKGTSRLKLYNCAFTRAAKCMWMITEMGIRDEIEIVNYDIYKVTEKEKQWYRDHVHPHATVPALVLENNQVLTESLSICMYLAERYGKLLPDEAERATYIDWCIYAGFTVDKILDEIYLHIFKKDNPPAEIEKRAAEGFDAFITRFDKHMAGRDFVCGNRLTTADIIMGFNIMWTNAMKGDALIHKYKNVSAYLERLKQRPIFTAEIGTAEAWAQGL